MQDDEEIDDFSLEKFDLQAIAQRRERFNRLPLKQSVSELEELPQDQIRGALEVFGILEDPLRLRETVEASLKLVGDEEHSAIMAVLEPEEIGQIVALSPEVFSQEICDLIHPMDFHNPDKWYLLTDEQRKRIESSGNKFYCQLIYDLRGESWAHQKDKGPWAIFKDHVKIFSQTVLGYVSAICFAHQRDDEWKLESLENIGLPLIAYAATECSEILDLCRELDDELVKRIRQIQCQPNFKQKALDQFQSAFEEIQEFLTQAPKEKKKPLMKLVDELREIGIENPTDEELSEFQDAGEAIEDALKTGIPENGEED